MPEGKETVKIHFAPEAAKQIPDLYTEMVQARKTSIEEMHRAVDRAMRVGEIKVSFYEKLVLLAGGSFALSLTLLGLLGRGSPHAAAITAVRVLYVAWGSLLLCIFFSWLHNWYRTSAADRLSTLAAVRAQIHENDAYALIFHKLGSIFKGAEITEWPDIDLNKILSVISDHMKKQADESAKNLDEYRAAVTAVSKTADRLGNLAMGSIFLGFLLLLVFAIENARLLT